VTDSSTGPASTPSEAVALPTVIFIRHGEKPDKDHQGVTPDGRNDEHSLSVRGWTRAGALAALFADVSTRPGLVTPSRVIVTAPSQSYKSKREHDTGLPTAQRLGITIESMVIPKDYSAVVQDIEHSQLPTLVVWHHGSIPAFVAAFAVTNILDVPQHWPESRFDLVWVLQPNNGGYRWSVLPQSLLRGDADD